MVALLCAPLLERINARMLHQQREPSNRDSNGNERSPTELVVVYQELCYKGKQGPNTKQMLRLNSIKLNGSGFYFILVLVIRNLNGHRRVYKEKRAKN